MKNRSLLVCRFILFSLIIVLIMPAFAQGPNIARPSIRLGIVGLSHDHVHAILGRADFGDIEIVGIAEPNRQLVKRLQKRYGFSMKIVYNSINKMLEKTQPEAVAAFNDIHGHLEVVKACAPRGIHVMVEKPLAVSLDHARKMKALADEHNIHLLTNYETTWYGSNHEAYHMVHGQQAIGEIRKMVVHDGHKGPREIGCSEEFLEWLTDPKLNGGGALTDFGCYGANLMTWLMQGERPVSVRAITQQIKPDIYPDVDDEATIIVEYPNAQGIIQASWNWPFNRKDMHVYGQTGYVKTIDGTRMNIRLSEKAVEEEIRANPKQKPYHEPFAYLAAVVNGKIDPGNDLSSLANNMVVMEILDAARRSAKSGKVIKLD